MRIGRLVLAARLLVKVRRPDEISANEEWIQI